MNIVSELTINALKEKRTEPLENYAASLLDACEVYPPPFGMAWYGEKYRQVACEPKWLANSLIENAAKEGEGARGLWRLASSISVREIAEQVRLHAIDESRHARLYIAMLDITFSGVIAQNFRSRLYGLSPNYKAKDQLKDLPKATEASVLDELIQMNIGEIRTRINQLLLRPVILAHCPSHQRNRLMRILDSLLFDETKHIEYTAHLIEQAMNRGLADFVFQTMRNRLAEFNQITLNEVGELSFDGA
jgi:hypothetical protein